MIDIIVPTWNFADSTLACFKSLKDCTKDFRIIWVDNGSLPKQRSKVWNWLDGSDLKYTYFAFEENMGFSKAINQGLGLSTASHIVLLNNDVVVTSGWLDKMLEFSDLNPKAGIIGVMTDTGAIQNYRKFYGELKDPEKTINSSPFKFISKHNGCVPFSCVLLRADMLAQVGLLDEDFSPCLGEDDDLCDRARLAGWQTVLLLNVLVWHRHRQTVSVLTGWQHLQDAHHDLYLRKYEARRKAK